MSDLKVGSYVKGKTIFKKKWVRGLLSIEEVGENKVYRVIDTDRKESVVHKDSVCEELPYFDINANSMFMNDIIRCANAELLHITKGTKIDLSDIDFEIVGNIYDIIYKEIE